MMNYKFQIPNFRLEYHKFNMLLKKYLKLIEFPKKDRSDELATTSEIPFTNFLLRPLYML
jgi:hypothetical protein